MGAKRNRTPDINYAKLREGLVALNCPNCAAPCSMKKCKYCDTRFSSERTQVEIQFAKQMAQMSEPMLTAYFREQQDNPFRNFDPNLLRKT